MQFQVCLSLWSVTSWLCTDKIPEVAKTKVSKPKRFFIKVKTLPHLPKRAHSNTPPHVYVTVWRERVRERERERITSQKSVKPVSFRNHDLFANTYGHHHCVCHVTLFPSRAWTDGKTKDIINCLYFHFKSWSSRLWKGALNFRHGLWWSAYNNALCQLANQRRLCLSEGGTL